MQEVTSWVFTICAGTLVCGVVSALVPGKSFEKAIQLLLGIFMLFCFLTPVAADWQLPTVDLEQAEQRRLEIAGQAEQQLGSQLQSDLVAQAEQQLATLLPQYGLQGATALLEVTAQPDGTLLLTVTLPQAAEPHGNALQAALSTALGTAVSLQYQGTIQQ